MVFKVSFNNQIHRIAKTPASHKELSQLVSQLFQNQLPESWTLQYVDSDGDSIMLSDEHDFQNLLEGELSGSNKAVKVFVVPVEGINQSQVRDFADESVTESQVKRQEDDFQVIEKQEPVPVEEPKVEQQEVAEEPKIEEPVEEAVQQEEPKVEVEQEIVQNSEPEQKEEVRCHRKRGGHGHFRVKKILKKLSKTDLSAEKRERLESKLREFETSLTSEEQERFAAKKEEFIKRRTEKKAQADSDFKERVTDILYQYLPTIASLTKEYVQEDNKPQSQPEPQVKPIVQATHSGVRCDGCSKYPLTGIRYKCYTCPDFDFCENCEATKEHAHAFIKIKDSSSFRNERRSHGSPVFPGCNRFKPAVWKCHRPENKTEETDKKVEEPKVPEFKNIFDLLLGNLPQQPTENKEKAEIKEPEIPEDLKKDFAPLYNGLPQELKNFANVFLGNLPEKLFANKTEAKPEEKIEVPKVEEPKKEEVVIAEEPVVNEIKAEVIENANGPVIQVVENVPEIIKEDPKPIKKEYPVEVRNKVATMMDIFPDANEEELLEFVSKTPNLALQELVENYLA